MSLYSPSPVAMLYTNTPSSSSIALPTDPMLPRLQQLSPMPADRTNSGQGVTASGLRVARSSSAWMCRSSRGASRGQQAAGRDVQETPNPPCHITTGRGPAGWGSRCCLSTADAVAASDAITSAIRLPEAAWKRHSSAATAASLPEDQAISEISSN